MQPVLSVALIVSTRRERAGAALASVLGQLADGGTEVVLVDCGAPGSSHVPGSDHPSVRTIALGPGVEVGPVRAAALRAARAPVVAFLEEHARARPGWAEALLAALERTGAAAVGPAMVCGNPWLACNRVLAELAYPRLVVPAAPAENEIPHHNSAYRRDVLLSYDEELDELFFPEPMLHRRLVRDGHRLVLADGMEIEHLFEGSTAGALPNAFLSARAFEAAYDRFLGRSPARRLVRALALPAAPIVRTGQSLLLARRLRRGSFGLLARHVHVLLALHGATAAGQAVGLLRGAGDTSRSFLPVWLDQVRPLERPDTFG